MRESPGCRYEPRCGPLRDVVRRDVFAYLACGRPMGGFARIRCPRCRGEHLLALSCHTRNLCPSCQAKRSALFGEWVTERVLAGVAHRHVVFTVPKRLRGLIERERGLHGPMAKAAWETLRDALSRAAFEADGVPGAVISISLQTFGPRRRPSAPRVPSRRARRQVESWELYRPSRRSSAPTSPGALQASAFSRISSL